MPGDLPPPDPSQRNSYEPERPYASEPASYERLRRVLIAVGGVAMVVFATGLGLLVLRDNGGDSRPEGATGTAPPDVTNPTVPSATSSASTAGPSSAPPTTTASTAPASAPPTTVSTTVAPTTVATTAAPTPATTSPPPAPDPSTSAVATAQALLDAFADGRWNDARVLNPGRNESDAFLQSAYGPIEQATIIPATVTPVSDGRYDMRFGIVSHESQPTGPQTVLMCSHWQVDVPTNTVLRLDSARLRVEGGYVNPNARASELSSVCAALPLK